MKTVLLLLANGFEMYEASVFIDVIGWNSLEGDRSTRLFTCGLAHEASSTFGQKMLVDYTIDEIDAADYDALAIPGGFEDYGFYDSAYQSKFLEVIQAFDRLGKDIATICTGALPLAKSGILNGRRATTYHLNTIRQQALVEGGALLQQQPIVVDGHIITSWNPSTAMDVAFMLLEKLTSTENVRRVKYLMGFEAG